jgi:hypothetical protein
MLSLRRGTDPDLEPVPHWGGLLLSVPTNPCKPAAWRPPSIRTAAFATRPVIQRAVWLYHRFSLRLRDVELILPARGVVVSYESIRDWSLRFGRLFANKLKRRRSQPGEKWHLDEVFVRIRGKLHYLWSTIPTSSTSCFRATAAPIQPSALPQVVDGISLFFPRDRDL